MVEQLFVCGDARLRESWGSAFPGARVATPAGPFPGGGTVWLRVPPGQPAARLVGPLRQRVDGRPLVILADEPSDDDALAALAAGVAGYCNSHAAPEVLQQVATVVQNGGLWVGQRLMQRLLAGTARLAAAVPPGARPDWAAALTEREREVARAVAQGASNKEIARRLDITERTVKAHVGAVLEKLGARDRLQLSLVVNGIDTGR